MTVRTGHWVPTVLVPRRATLLFFIIIFHISLLIQVVFSVFYLCLLRNTSPISLCPVVSVTNVLNQSIVRSSLSGKVSYFKVDHVKIGPKELF